MREEKLWDLRDQSVACAVPGFLMGWRGHCQNNPILAVYDADTGDLAGGMEGKNVFVLPQYRGRKLGAEILIVAFENGLRHPGEMNHMNILTKAGRANRIAAHRIAVERALDNGLDVPEDVLANYPWADPSGLRM